MNKNCVGCPAGAEENTTNIAWLQSGYASGVKQEIHFIIIAFVNGFMAK